MFFFTLDNQSVMTHPTIGGDSTSLSNSVTHLVDDRSNESTKALPGTGGVSLCESLPQSNRYDWKKKKNFVQINFVLVSKFKQKLVIVKVSILKV